MGRAREIPTSAPIFPLKEISDCAARSQQRQTVAGEERDQPGKTPKPRNRRAVSNSGNPITPE